MTKRSKVLKVFFFTISLEFEFLVFHLVSINLQRSSRISSSASF